MFVAVESLEDSFLVTRRWMQGGRLRQRFWQHIRCLEKFIQGREPFALVRMNMAIETNWPTFSAHACNSFQDCYPDILQLLMAFGGPAENKLGYLISIMGTIRRKILIWGLLLFPAKGRNAATLPAIHSALHMETKAPA